LVGLVWLVWFGWFGWFVWVVLVEVVGLTFNKVQDNRYINVTGTSSNKKV
jgi:hypothetical protein